MLPRHYYLSSGDFRGRSVIMPRTKPIRWGSCWHSRESIGLINSIWFSPSPSLADHFFSRLPCREPTIIFIVNIAIIPEGENEGREGEKSYSSSWDRHWCIKIITAHISYIAARRASSMTKWTLFGSASVSAITLPRSLIDTIDVYLCSHYSALLLWAAMAFVWLSDFFIGRVSKGDNT